MEKFLKVLCVMLIFVPLLCLEENKFKIKFEGIKIWKVYLYKVTWMFYGVLVVSD